MQFNKSTLSLLAQIKLLKNRGLIIENDDRAIRYLSHIGYYRLSAYMIPFYINKKEKDHKFLANTTFNQILNLYIFDRKLRLILLEAIERIEISFRSVINNSFVLATHSHSYLENEYFQDNEKHKKLLKKITKAFKNSKEVFIQHYKNTYSEPKLPPLWMTIHVLTFKEVFYFYENIKCKKLKQQIAQTYNLQNKLLVSWIRVLSDLRNFCAHHARVWNRNFGTTPMTPKTKKNNLIKWPKRFENIICTNGQEIQQKNSLYALIVIIWYFLSQMNTHSTWIERFTKLCQDHQIDMRKLGFSKDWQDDPFWS